MASRYKPVIRNQPPSFWSKYIENRREREKQQQQQQQLKQPLNLNNINNKLFIKKANEKIDKKDNSVKKPAFGTSKSNTEEVPKPRKRKREEVEQDDTIVHTQTKPKPKAKPKRRAVVEESEPEEASYSAKQPRLSVSRRKKDTLFDEVDTHLSEPAQLYKKERNKPVLDDNELVALAKQFSQTYEQTQPSNGLLKYSQKKNIRALSHCLSKIVNKDKFLYPLLTVDEKTTLKNNHKNLLKIISPETTEAEKRTILLENPELTGVTTNFLSSLEIYNDGEGEEKEQA